MTHTDKPGLFKVLNMRLLFYSIYKAGTRFGTFLHGKGFPTSGFLRVLVVALLLVAKAAAAVAFIVVEAVVVAVVRRWW